MTNLRNDRIYKMGEIVQACSRAGQFCHLDRDTILDHFDRLFDHPIEETKQQTLAELHKQGLSKEKLFYPKFAIWSLFTEEGATCAICAQRSTWGGGGRYPPVLNKIISPSFLALVDKSGNTLWSTTKKDWRSMDATCEPCGKLIETRVWKRFGRDIETIIEPEKFWVATFSEIVKNKNVLQRIQENKRHWNKLQFDPRRTAPA